MYVQTATAWNETITINGGGNNDQIYFQVSNATFDLRSATLTDIEYVSSSGSNTTVLIDSATLQQVERLIGSTTSRFVTDDTDLDLTGILSVSGVGIESSNATGTTFEVDDKNIAFQVRGGTGFDTIDATGVTFTADELAYIFNVGSIELVVDAGGTHAAPALVDTFILTTGTDTPTMSAASETVNGSAQTLSSGDLLDGLGGHDVLALYGAGTFNLNSLAAFANFEEVRLFGLGGSQQDLYLRNGTTLDVSTSGSGTSRIYLQGTGSASSITSSSGSLAMYVQTATAWNETITINGGSNTDQIYFQASNATFDLRSATLTDIEYVSSSGSNTTVLIDSATLQQVERLIGSTTSRFVTDDTDLDLTGILSVSGVGIESSNATGTTFEVDDKNIAFQIRGGTGFDTIDATGVTFTADELAYIFNVGSIELVVDAGGTHAAPALVDTFILTTGTDTPTMSAASETVNGSAQTLSSGDSLDGLGGHDVLALYGAGTFNLNSLAAFANFEEVRLFGLGGSQQDLYLRNGTTLDVSTSGNGTSRIYLQGTGSASSITSSSGSLQCMCRPLQPGTRPSRSMAEATTTRSISRCPTRPSTCGRRR